MKIFKPRVFLFAVFVSMMLPLASRAETTLFYVDLVGETQTFEWNRSAPHESCGEGYSFNFETTGGSKLTSNQFTMKIKTISQYAELVDALMNKEKIDVTLYFQKKTKNITSDYIVFTADNATVLSIEAVNTGSDQHIEVQFQASNYDWETP